MLLDLKRPQVHCAFTVVGSLLMCFYVFLFCLVDTIIVLEQVEPHRNMEAAASPVKPPAKHPKLSSHQELLTLEKERCMLDIENAKIKKDVLLLQKEVLTLQKQRLLDLSQSRELECFLNEF